MYTMYNRTYRTNVHKNQDIAHQLCYNSSIWRVTFHDKIFLKFFFFFFMNIVHRYTDDKTKLME